jgi:membrane dipeptidase
MNGVETVLAHIDHAVEVVGIDHIGLGPDYEMGIMVPDGLETAAQLPMLTAALLNQGYLRDDVKKILGGNFMRLFREIIG